MTSVNRFAIVLSIIVLAFGGFACASRDATPQETTTADGAEGTVWTPLTLSLTGGEMVRKDYPAPVVDKDHPEGTNAYEVETKLTGDRTGEYVLTCTPVVVDDISCSGAFLFEDGDVEFEGTSEGDHIQSNAEASVVGGSGAYGGATGTANIDWENNTYTLDLLIPTI